MSGNQTPDGAPSKSAEPSVTEAASDAMPEPVESSTAAADARIAELEAQIADLTDRLLRAHAEMDNVRKRAEREKADMAKYAIAKFAADVLTIGDNFSRAASAVPPAAAEQDAALKSLLDGVTMMEREFLNVLERHGVKRIDPSGQPFNPHLHQAVMEQENPEVPNGTVTQVFQLGYSIEDRVLRPAMVVVAKGGPKPAERQAPDPVVQPAQPPSEAGQDVEDPPKGAD